MKKEVETVPRNFRCLSLVVLERLLMYFLAQTFGVLVLKKVVTPSVWHSQDKIGQEGLNSTPVESCKLLWAIS